MDSFAKETLPISLEEEMRRSYLDYAMSLNVDRALPAICHWCQPVQPRGALARGAPSVVRAAWRLRVQLCAWRMLRRVAKKAPKGDEKRRCVAIATQTEAAEAAGELSLIPLSEPTRPYYISSAVFCL